MSDSEIERTPVTLLPTDQADLAGSVASRRQSGPFAVGRVINSSEADFARPGPVQR
jgi:hypothetical protein